MGRASSRSTSPRSVVSSATGSIRLNSTSTGSASISAASRTVSGARASIVNVTLRARRRFRLLDLEPSHRCHRALDSERGVADAEYEPGRAAERVVADVHRRRAGVRRPADHGRLPRGRSRRSRWRRRAGVAARQDRPLLDVRLDVNAPRSAPAATNALLPTPAFLVPERHLERAALPLLGAARPPRGRRRRRAGRRTCRPRAPSPGGIPSKPLGKVSLPGRR